MTIETAKKLVEQWKGTKPSIDQLLEAATVIERQRCAEIVEEVGYSPGYDWEETAEETKKQILSPKN